jgi:hypothetical protein
VSRASLQQRDKSDRGSANVCYRTDAAYFDIGTLAHAIGSTLMNESHNLRPAEEYRAKARECERLAESMHSMQCKMQLLAAARRWNELADAAQRISDWQAANWR